VAALFVRRRKPRVCSIFSDISFQRPVINAVFMRDPSYRNRIYYRIKPLIPARLRLSVRRWFALRKRDQVRDTWPISPGSERAPEKWTGWPEGKKFALVLTHDVEGEDGLLRCERLMELEMSMGFRSSFNFIPEGGYRVSQALREKLSGNGFEVGVHDLRHDGRLYHTRRQFSENAIRINEYLRDWNAAGFRSGFMLHNLNWLHELNIEYDASTFDTDPFEPQPDSRNTIFPFWVPAPSAGNGGIKNTKSHSSVGYVELPYTLPQDSTLFLILREQTPRIWIEKLDWIAQHGGMALLNVHPDYLAFQGESPSSRTYSVDKYIEFLKHVRERYEKVIWQPLPRDLARYVSAVRPAIRKRNRVCMVTHSFYETDNRVTRYAEALAQRGDEVDVIALQRNVSVPTEEVITGVNVHRLQLRAGKNEQAKLDYLFPLVRFLFVSALWLARRQRQKPYDLIHVHNIPDFLVFSAWYPKRNGAKVLLDIHDIVPEFYGSKFGVSKDSVAVRILKTLERASAKFADHVILANHLWLEKYVSRSASAEKCSVFINNVDPNIFKPASRVRGDDKQIILFPGGLQWHQGIDIAIRAFKKVTEKLPKAEFHIYGEGNMKNQLVELAAELGLEGKVRFGQPVPVREIAKIMANADLGIVPKRADSFGNEAYSTKIMEFMSLGVPVVVSSTKIDRFYFNDSVVRFFESGNPDALADGIIEVLTDAKRRAELVSNASRYVDDNSWDSRKTDYLWLVDNMISSEDGVAIPPLVKATEPARPVYSVQSAVAAKGNDSAAIKRSQLRKFEQCTQRVGRWVEERDYKGYDPGDGLTSWLRPLTFGNLFAERVLQQSVWKAPWNIRPLVGVKPLDSTKGRGFMAWGYLMGFKRNSDTIFRDKAIACLDWLMANKTPKYPQYCWGNHFDFSSRGGRIPAHEPTIVWSGLIGQAFLEGFEQTGDEKYLRVAESIGEWILNLPRERAPNGVCLSYHGCFQSSIHNSNLLGAAVLARAGKHIRRAEFVDVAREAVRYACHHQLADGAWWYGEEEKYRWIDNFHTGYNLDSIKRYREATGDNSFDKNLHQGYEYFVKTFFEASGCPRYYHNQTFPVDIQCASQAIDTLAFFADEHPEGLKLAAKIAEWTMNNLQDPSGYFYYRKYPMIISRTPYFHWGQATMFKALEHLLLKVAAPEQIHEVSLARELATV
jgi:glycosyltransferase involved in cell wall biosynthesis/rhamnogalacturonyl hydrolase YesR